MNRKSFLKLLPFIPTALIAADKVPKSKTYSKSIKCDILGANIKDNGIPLVETTPHTITVKGDTVTTWPNPERSFKSIDRYFSKKPLKPHKRYRTKART